MNIIGKWKIKEFRLPIPFEERNNASEDPSDVIRTYTPDALPDSEEFAEFAQMAKMIFEFAPDGNLYTIIPIPEELYEQAKNEGAEIRDGFAVIGSSQWKEQDSKFFYDSHTEGEVLGDKIDPFVEIKLLPDGCLLYGMDTIVLERE